MTLKEVADRMVWEALQKKWREMLPFQLTSAIQAQRRCIHGHYYLRSFERRGDQFGAGRWGFLLVDMRTGGWREITTFPYDEGYRLLRLNLHQVQFTRDGRRIVVRGTGLDPQLWTIGPNYGDLPDSKPTPALLAYDVEKIELRPAEQYVSRRKLLFGKPAEFKAEVASVDGRKTTLDDLISRIGRPRLVNMMYGRTATWTYAYEVGGIVYADELYCKLNKRKVAKSCKYICYPSELVSVDPYTRECIRPD